MSKLPEFTRSQNFERFCTRKTYFNNGSLYILIPNKYCKANNITKETFMCFLWDKDNQQLVIYKNSLQPNKPKQ